MLIYLIRHGETAYNTEKRYQGRLDIPLSPQGMAQLRRAGFSPEIVYVTPLLRTQQTAAILFPTARQVIVDSLREMDFGIFEGRSFLEMEHDPQYRAWVDSGCALPCPGGESRDDFSARTCAAFAPLVDVALAQGAERLVVVAHGGTQMAVMARYAHPRREFHRWHVGNGGGFVLDAEDWPSQRTLRLVETISCATEDD